MKFSSLEKHFGNLLDSGIAIELVSEPGLGKSEFVTSQIPVQSERTGTQWGFQTLFLATQTPSELMGYMVPTKVPFVQGEVETTKVVSAYTMPPWLFTTEGRPLADYKRGILFLDEYGQGDQDVKRVSAELLLNGRIGPWKLPKGWSVVAASNRAGDRSGVTKSFDFVINRRQEIHVTSDIESWETWAMRKQISPAFITFAVQNPTIVFSGGVPDKQGPWCTPRSLVMAERQMKIFAGASSKLPTDGDTAELIAGLIGKAATAQLFVFIRMGNDLPTYEDVMRSPQGTPVPSKPDEQMLMCHMLGARVTNENIGPIVDYMGRFPKEFSVTFVKGVVLRDRKLTGTEAIRGWIKNNASLVSAISSFN